MSRNVFVVSVPVVVVRNYVVAANTADEACELVKRMPGESFERSMYSERLVGMYETFDGTPLKATPLTELLDEPNTGSQKKEVLS